MYVYVYMYVTLYSFRPSTCMYITCTIVLISYVYHSLNVVDLCVSA